VVGPPCVTWTSGARFGPVIMPADCFEGLSGQLSRRVFAFEVSFVSIGFGARAESL
jgi:hypothetical protein